MSSDFDKTIQGRMTELYYDSNQPNSQTQKYRLLDAPFTRYWIGFARWLTNSAAQPQDWNWSMSWDQNGEAYPDPKLLTTARLSIAIFLPITIVLFFLLTNRLFGFWVSLSGTILLMFNSLILLHTRRAMAEGPLLFFLILSLYLLFRLPKNKLWVASIAVGFAINTKQSLYPLLLIALLIIVFQNRASFKTWIRQVITFIAICLIITALLNPVLWKEPLQPFNAMWQQRSNLTADQVAGISDKSDYFILDTPIERFTAMVGQLFVISPAPADIANYVDDQRLEVQKYFSNPIQRGLTRNLSVAMFSLVLTLMGTIAAIRSKIPDQFIFLTIFVVFILEILIAFQIPFQRYYLLLIPFSNLFITYGAVDIFRKIARYRRPY